ncbi:MAG: hypothetical protein ACR5LF_11280 [Symbiopectobacterium sp.]
MQRSIYLIERGAGAILMLFGGYLLLGLWLADTVNRSCRLFHTR